MGQDASLQNAVRCNNDQTTELLDVPVSCHATLSSTDRSAQRGPKHHRGCWSGLPPPKLSLRPQIAEIQPQNQNTQLSH